MTDIAAGFWPCKVIDAFYGDDATGIPVVRINVELIDGRHKGLRMTYEERVNNKQAPYIARTCLACGWKGGSMSTLKADVAEWVRSEGFSTLEIKHIEIRNGKRAGQIWAKPNSIGRGPKPLRESSKENLLDVDAMMRSALSEDSQSGAPPPDDIPPAGDDDIPFCSLSMTAAADRAVIAKVIR